MKKQTFQKDIKEGLGFFLKSSKLRKSEVVNKKPCTAGERTTEQTLSELRG